MVSVAHVFLPCESPLAEGRELKLVKIAEQYVELYVAPRGGA